MQRRKSDGVAIAVTAVRCTALEVEVREVETAFFVPLAVLGTVDCTLVACVAIDVLQKTLNIEYVD
jgi:hypothetical protein